MEDDIKQNMLKYEKGLSKYACLTEDAIRLRDIKEDFRPAYFRDTDKIIYSLAYTRYIDKTQVFSGIDNDHITKRVLHVQLVSKIARTIGRALNLNEDLIEAIALGHDIGHIPFGHTGESILSEISFEKTGRYFYHNIHSVRTLMNVENGGKGYNLTVQVLDGIMCHNGEITLNEYRPIKKTVSEFLDEYEKAYTDPKVCLSMRPMTLEGCVVRISDIIGYLGRDVEDAIRLNIITKEQIPKEITEVLGNDNKTIVNTIVMDIIQNSLDKPYIKLSNDVFNAIESLKKFNYEFIYSKANTKEQLEEYKKMFRFLFDTYLYQLKHKDGNSNFYKVYLKEQCKEYLESTSDEQKAIDYIAGMTDDYFIKEYKLLRKEG